MCGIVAAICKEPCLNEELIGGALKAIEHRGPDGYGYWISEDKRVAIGNTRLAIIDPKDEGLQPFFNEDGRFGIVMNGEIYNYKEIMEKIKDKHEFVSKTDTETVLHFFEEVGTNIVNYMRGMFAIAIWDDLEKKMYLFRDHVGKKPLFYYRDEELFVAASEPSAINHVLKGLGKKVRPSPLGTFYGFVSVSPIRYSLFEGVDLLEHSHMMEVDLNLNIKIKRYYKLDFREAQKEYKWNGLVEYGKRLYEKLVEATAYRLVADVPIAISMSAGVDSTLLAGIIAKELGQNLLSITVSAEGEYDEGPLARKIAEELGLEHKLIYVELDDFLKYAKEIIKKTHLPPTDPALVLGYVVAKQARSLGYKVLIVGEGGDELFMGYPNYTKIYSWFSNPLVRLPLDILKVHDVSAYAPLHYVRAVLCVFPHLRYITMRTFSGSTFCQAISHLPHHFEILLYAFRMKEEAPNPKNFAEYMLSHEYEFRIPRHLTLKVDFASMSASVEARAPLLDYKLIKFAMSIPPEYKKMIMIKRRKLFGKLFLRKFLSKEMADEVISKKIGFGMQVEHIMRKIIEENLVNEMERTEFLKKLIPIEVAKKIDVQNVYMGWVLYMLATWENEIFS